MNTIDWRRQALKAGSGVIVELGCKTRSLVYDQMVNWTLKPLRELMIKITDCDFINNGVAIAVGPGVAVELENSRLSGNHIAILEYASKGELNAAIAALGFKPEVPRDELRELLLSLKDTPQEKREELLQGASLLERARNFVVEGVNTTANILSIVNSSQFQTIINALM